jgi:hypothetical protein
MGKASVFVIIRELAMKNRGLLYLALSTSVMLQWGRFWWNVQFNIIE